ncbi:MAG: PQQ-dependent sugar dehydrogenase [Deltaproteobacteria bacterium]|nr:PQQ-dependent sugar dehydrogenase [Deltaproteobacteria bacterium]
MTKRAATIALLLIAGCGDDDTGTPDAAPTDGEVQPDAPGREVVGVAFEPIAVDGDFFTDVAPVPGTTDELFVATHPGTVLHLRVAGAEATVLGELTVPEVAVMVDCGLLALTPDPDWETNGFLYAGHCIATDFATRVTRVTFDGSDYDVADSAVTILEVRETRGPFPFNHNVSNLLFDDAGVMTVGIGDKSAVAQAPGDPTSLAGSILRIVPSREPGVGGYEPAEGNPFTDPSEGAPEVWAYGVRYPWRIVPHHDGFIFGDVGEGAFEEVDVAPSGGLDFGWPECSGPCDPPDDSVAPVIWYPHDDDHPYVDEDPETAVGPNRAVWVAPPRPATADDPFDGYLDDRILFGDVCTGWFRGARFSATGEVTDDELLAHVNFVTDVAWTPDGTGYVTTFGSCNSTEMLEPARLLRVVPRYAD